MGICDMVVQEVFSIKCILTVLASVGKCTREMNIFHMFSQVSLVIT